MATFNDPSRNSALFNAISRALAGQVAGSQPPQPDVPGQATTVQTGLADLTLAGPAGLGVRDFRDIDELVRARTDPALSILTQGSEEAQRLSRLGQQEATQGLDPFTGLAAFNEQQALLGTSGEAAQQAAISGIPVSAFDRELQRRQQQQLLRQASARGELGSGSTLVAGQQLAGGQRAETIQRRLAELEPLVAASRGVRSAQAGIDQSSRDRQAALQSALGPQLSSIRFGATAPLISARTQQAQIGGLRDISRANRQGQIGEQLAGLAGQFAPQIASLFQPSTQPTAALQTGTTQNFIPQAGIVGIA